MEDENQIVEIPGVNTNEEPELAKDGHVRFSGLMWYNPTFLDITIGGAGGIGSWFTTLISRIGVSSLHLYDMDTIDTTNLGGQLYKTGQVNMSKVEAVRQNVIDFCDTNINTYQRYTEEDGVITPVMVSCFDNMDARKIFFESWASDPDRKLFMDGRMLAESFQIFTVLPGQEDRYRKTLFADSEVEEQACSAKATSHTGAIIGGMMTSIITNFMTNTKLGVPIKEVPFKTGFQISLLTLDVEP